MLATDKVHKDSDRSKNAKDLPKPDSLASGNDQIFKERLQRFKKASGQSVPALRVRKLKSEVTSENKRNSFDCGNIQKTSTSKYNIQRSLADKCKLQRPVIDKCNIQRPVIDNRNIQRSFTDKCDIRRSLIDNCNITRIVTDDDKAAVHGIQGNIFVCSQAAEFRRQLQNSHNRQRLLTTLAFAEREQEEEECGYRMSSNGVLVSTRKTDIYTNVKLLAPETEGENSPAVLDSDDSTDEGKANTSDEVEDEGNDDYDTDGSEKLTNSSREWHCKDVHSKDYNYNGSKTVNMLHEGNKSIDEKYSKEMPGSKLKVRYIFDSAELECYDYCFGKNSFVPTDYIGNFRVQRVQSPKFTNCNSKSLREIQEDTKKTSIVPDVFTSEDNVKLCAPQREKTQTPGKEWPEGANKRTASIKGQQDIMSVNESSEDNTGPSFTCRVENKYEQSICAFQNKKANNVATCFSEIQYTRSQTEAMKYEVGKNALFMLEHKVGNSVMESIKCEDNSDIACEKNRQNNVRVYQEFRSGNPQLINTSQDGGEERQETEHGIPSEKYDMENVAHILESKKVTDEIQEINSTHESQSSDKEKREIGSVLLTNDNTTKKLTSGCELLSRDVSEDTHKAGCNSDLQEDTVSNHAMGFVLDNSDDVVGNYSTGSDNSGMIFLLMPDHTGGDSRGAGCISQQHEGFKDIDEECVSIQLGDFEDKDDECVPRKHRGFEDNDAECVSRQHGHFEDINVECVSRHHEYFEDINVECVSRHHEYFEDINVECVSRHHEYFEDINVECVSRHHEYFEDINVECVSRQHGYFENINVECVSRQTGNVEDTNVECVSRQHGHFEDINVECVSRQTGNVEDNDVECVSRQTGNVEDINVECVSIQTGNVEDTNVECVSRQLGHFEDINVECVSRQTGNVEDNNDVGVPQLRGVVEDNNLVCVSIQHEILEDNDSECSSRQQECFEDTGVGCFSRHHGEFEDNNSDIVSRSQGIVVDYTDEGVGGFKQSHVASVSNQHRVLENMENNDAGCVDMKHGSVEGNKDEEIFTGFHDCMEDYQNVEYVSRPRMQSEEGHKQCHDKNEKGGKENKLRKVMEGENDEEIGVEHEEVNHKMTEKSKDRNEDIQKSDETKCLQSNVITGDAGEQEGHEQDNNVEQEQSNHDGNISPVSRNEEDEIASEDDASKKDLARELLCSNGFRSGDRKYASPYSKFQQCHEDILKRLTNHDDDSFEYENGDYLSGCEYECSEQYKEETDEENNKGIDEETDEEINEDTDKDIEADPCYDAQPKKLNAQVTEDNAAECTTNHSDTIQKGNGSAAAQNLNEVIQSIARCQNKLLDQCYMKDRCVQRNEVENKVQGGYRKISSAEEDTEENANQDLHIHKTKEDKDSTDYTQENIFRAIQVMNGNEETMSTASSTTSCSRETLSLQIVKNFESRASPASLANRSHSCEAHCDTRRNTDDNGLGDNLIASKVERVDQFAQRYEEDNFIDNDHKSALALNNLQNEVDRSRSDKEKNNTPISSPKDNNSQDCLKYRTAEDSRASASILEEASGDSISPQCSTINTRNESTKQRKSQASSRTNCSSRNNRRSSTDIGIAPEFNCATNVGDTDGSISRTPCIVQHSGKVITTSPDRRERVCNSMHLSKSQICAPVRYNDLANIDGTYLNNAGYFSLYKEYNIAIERDYKQQCNGINLQTGGVNNLTDEKPVDETSMIKLITAPKAEHTSINHIRDTEQITLTSKDTLISCLKENGTQCLVYSVAEEVNPASGVKENCIGSTTVSKTATESFTELDISCSSDCALGSDPTSREVLNEVGCMNSPANTPVSSTSRNDIIEGITGINRALLYHADMHGHEIGDENRDNQSDHNSEEREITKNNLSSVSKLSPHQTLSNIAIYEQGRSENDNYKNEIITATKHCQSWKITTNKEEEEEKRQGQETSKEDLNERDLDCLHQRLERLPAIAASGDFTTPSKPTTNNETDRRLGELLSVQRQTCGIMMKNVLRRAGRSKNLYKTTKTKPTVHAENRNPSPLFCMVTGSKIEARIKETPNKVTHRSNTQTACRGHKLMHQRQNQEVELDGRHQTMSNSSNVRQLPENKTNRSNTYKKWSSKDFSEGSKPVDNANANEEVQGKSTKTLLQSKGNLRNLLKTDQTVKESKLAQESNTDKQSFTTTTVGQKGDWKYSGQCNDKLTFSKIPRLVKTATFSETKHTQGNKNTNYSEVSDNLEQSNSEACDLSQSLAQHGQSPSRAAKDSLIFTDSHHDELVFTDVRGGYLETYDLGQNHKGFNFQETEVNDDIVTHQSSDENELHQGLDSEHDLHRINAFEDKSAGNYFNNYSVTYAHTKEGVFTLGPTRNIPHKNSPQLWEDNCHCQSLKTRFNQKDVRQIQQTCRETDRSPSVTQRFIIQSHQMLCKVDTPVSLTHCSMTQPCEVLGETDRSVSVNQCSLPQHCVKLCETDGSVSLIHHSIIKPDETHCETIRPVSLSQCSITQAQGKLRETEISISAHQYPITPTPERLGDTDTSVAAHQISKPITKSINNEPVFDKSTHPAYNTRAKQTDHNNEQFVEYTHLSHTVSEQLCYSSRLPFIDNIQQQFCWNNATNECITPATDITNADIASTDTPTFSDLHEKCSRITKEEDQKMTTILTNTDSPWNITRNGAESTEYSRTGLNIRANSEEKFRDCVKECNTSQVNTRDITNSGKIRTRKHVCKSSISDTASFRCMVKTLMNQSEDFASDSDNDSSPFNDRRKRKELAFPVSSLGNGISNFAKAEINEANYQTPTDFKKAACDEEGTDKPTYAELKARALAKALPVLSKLKVQCAKNMQTKPTAMDFPCESVVKRTVLKTSEIHPSGNATSLNYSTGIKAGILTNEYFEETDNSGIIMNESYYNCCSVFNINNSKSEQEIDLENDNTRAGHDYNVNTSTKFNIDQNNLAQTDVSAVLSRGQANIHQSSNTGKTRFRRKCRIPVRQNRDPRVLLDELGIPQEQHSKKPRDIVMVLKSKKINKGSVAAALSLIQPAESSMLNTEDTKPITELPKHVQVFARGNGLVVEVCADSSSTAVSVSNLEQVRAPLAERIKKYQLERPRNILAGRNRTQDDNTLGSASKRSKKLSDNISSCSEVSSIASNLHVHDCEQVITSVNPCIRIDNMRERDTPTPRSSKTFKVSNDEDAVIDVKSNQKLPVRGDGVSHEDIAIQTSDNTLASAVTVEKTHMTVLKKDAAEQVSMSSSNKSNSGAKELNENAAVAQSKSLGENDSSYTEVNSKSSEKQLVSGSLIKARTYLSEARKRYLQKNVAFSSKLPKTTAECTKNPKHNSTTCVSKHAVHTLHSRQHETLEKATKSESTNSKRQQRYKRQERPVCVQPTTQNISSNLLSNCQLFSPSSQESNEPSLQQDLNSTNQNGPCVNIQNIDTHQRDLSNSRNTNTVNVQDDRRQRTTLTRSECYRNAACPRLDGEETRFHSNLDVALQNEECRPSSSNTCIDEQKRFETRSSRNFWERDEDHLEFIKPHSGSASHTSFHSSQYESHELRKLNQTEWVAGDETVIPDSIDLNRPKQSAEYDVSQPESNIQGTKDALLSLTGKSELNLQECTHEEDIPDSGLTPIQQVNNGAVLREESCKQVSAKPSEAELKKSTQFRETNTYENLTLERTSGDFCNTPIADCPSPLEGEAMKLSRPSSSETCHVLNNGLLANSLKTAQQPGYKVMLPLSSSNKQKENVFSPIPATLSPTTSVKHPKTRSLLLKSMVFTVADSSSKSSLRSNENGNAHAYLATRRSDSCNPLSMFRNGSPHSAAGISNLTDDMCLCSGTLTCDNCGTLTCENCTAPVGEWPADMGINPTSRIAGDGEHNQVYLPQNDSGDLSGRSARINNKTPRSSHRKNGFSTCLQSQTPDRSTRTVKILETLTTSSGTENENWQTENVGTLNVKPLSSLLGKCDDKEKIGGIKSNNYKQDSGNRISNTLELVPITTGHGQMSSLMPTPIRHKAMTTPRKGKLTLTSLEMTDYEGLSPELANSCGSFSYSTTSPESAGETCVYSSHAHVPVLDGPLINSNDAQQMPGSSARSSRPKKSSRTSDETHESVTQKLPPPVSPEGQSGLTPLPSKQSGLPPLSSRQSGLPHRAQFKRYY